MKRREYKAEEFEPVYALAKDVSSVGAFGDGDPLYVLDVLDVEKLSDEVGVFMRQIRVRLHQSSGKPFIDLDAKIGMELTFLRPQHGVYVHASHRAFDKVRRDNAIRGHERDEFKAALTAVFQKKELSKN